MKFKLNWGQSIAVVLFLFVIFIGSFVYKTLFVSEYDHALVSKEYYKEEMHYQEEIDRLENASKLNENIEIDTNSNGITIQFPSSMDYKEITAHLKLMYNTDTSFDIEKEIKLDSLSFQISDKDLVKGRYLLKLIWEINENSYQLNEKIDY
ncbi:MAG TPA: hypothetical protein EYG92_03560 [Lutibacter sp.]|nr:hypothetical protein [Lutibacter sp.]